MCVKLSNTKREKVCADKAALMSDGKMAYISRPVTILVFILSLIFRFLLIFCSNMAVLSVLIIIMLDFSLLGVY